MFCCDYVKRDSIVESICLYYVLILMLIKKMRMFKLYYLWYFNEICLKFVYLDRERERGLDWKSK